MRSLFRNDQPPAASTDPDWTRKEQQQMTAQQYVRMVPQAYPLFAHREGTVSLVIGWVPYRDEDEPDHELEEGSYEPVLINVGGYFPDGVPWKANLVEQSRITYFLTEEQARTAGERYFRHLAESTDSPKTRKPPQPASP